MGMPQMALLLVSAAGFTTSLAPRMMATSAWPNSPLMSSISKTWSYGTSASASSTFIRLGIRPVTGWKATIGRVAAPAQHHCVEPTPPRWGFGSIRWQ
jgi:hypothetical protein